MTVLDKREIISSFVSCQRVGPPYRGWDLLGFKKVCDDLKEKSLSFNCSNTLLDKESFLISEFMKGYDGVRWNVSHMCEVARLAREYLNLPSVDELNPDIAAMRSHFRENMDGG